THSFQWTVYVNQIPLGFTCRPDALLRYVRLLRRAGVVSSDISCSYGSFSDPWDVCVSDRVFQAAQTISPTNRDDSNGVDENGNLVPFDIFQPWLNPDWCTQAGYLRKYVI